MAADMKVWRKVLLQIVEAVADEEFQRRAWFGIGPEQSSPGETVNQFFSNAAFQDFLARHDNGLSREQTNAGRQLYDLMERFISNTPVHLKPEQVIDEPRWGEIRQVAKRFLELMDKPNGTDSE